MIFDECEKLSKMSSLRDGILLFFDEFEFLASENILTKEVKGTLLNYLKNNSSNGLRNEDSKIVFFAATNYYDRIDEDVKGKGKIDTHIEILNPTEEVGIKILKGKIAIDGHINNMEDSLISDIYLKIKNNKEAHMKNSYTDLTPNKILPSASEIVNVFKEIKRKSFNKNKILDNKLIIDDEIINDFFNSL